MGAADELAEGIIGGFKLAGFLMLCCISGAVAYGVTAAIADKRNEQERWVIGNKHGTITCGDNGSVAFANFDGVVAEGWVIDVSKVCVKTQTPEGR